MSRLIVALILLGILYDWYCEAYCLPASCLALAKYVLAFQDLWYHQFLH